ncbi:MAG: DedA family protein [Treponema sp.]|nr:DedA family protein [Treponema sp.]
MPDIVSWISQYTEYFPLAAFLGLMLAGLNIPISEDLIIITGALICRGDPEVLIPTFAAIFLGVVISDYFPYLIGKYIRKGDKISRFVTLFFTHKNIEKMQYYLEKYGIFTFIVCRFIPFGVRNTLIMTSGFTGLNLRRFALYEITASSISVSTLFFLVYRFGEVIGKPFQAVGVALFILVLSAFVFIMIRIIRGLIQNRKKTGE